MKSYTCLILLHVSALVFADSSEITPMMRVSNLTNRLLMNYDKRVRPFDESHLTHLMTWSYIFSISEFDDIRGRLSLMTMISMLWTDQRLLWEEDVENISALTFRREEVWVPLITLRSSSAKVELLGNDWDIVICMPSGTLEWNTQDFLQSTCVPDIKKYPFDSQVCDIQLMPLSFGDREAIKMESMREDVGLAFYQENGAWEITKTRAFVDYGKYGMQTYHMEITLQRRSTFVVVSLILPITCMGFLNLLVFLLPPDSGERVGYSITVLLAITVFLTIASDNLPHISTPSIPLLCIKLMTDMVISCFVMLFTVVSLRFYHSDKNTDIPRFLGSLTRSLLCKHRNRKSNESNKRICLNFNTTAVEGNEDNIDKGTHINDSNDERRDRGEDTDFVLSWMEVGNAFDILFFMIILISLLISHVMFAAFVLN